MTDSIFGSAQSDLLDYDALGLAGLIRRGELSQKELLDSVEGRVARLEPRINALTTMNWKRARARTQEISTTSVFSGVPVLVKDLVDVAGMARSSGSRFSKANIAKESVDYIKAVETAGLNILGMTNTPEFASLVITDNDVFGATRNPWNLNLSAGGSSGGSAAAVAAGYVPIAHGTDGGGSNRIPASFCGLLGMKPSRHRQVSGELDGKHMFLRTHQVLSRTVRDSAALFAVTENIGNDSRYAPAGRVSSGPTRRLKIAVSMENYLNERPVGTIEEAISKTAKLCESLGHSVDIVSNPVDGHKAIKALEGIMLVNMPGLISLVEDTSGKPAEESGLLTRALIDLARHAATLPEDSYRSGIEWFNALAAQFKATFFEEYDLWLTPTTPIEAPDLGYIGPNSKFNQARARNHSLMSYTAVANGIGAPAMSVPLFVSGSTGMPIGSHFTAAPGHDRLLYELAFELEAAKPWANQWAPNSAKFL